MFLIRVDEESGGLDVQVQQVYADLSNVVVEPSSNTDSDSDSDRGYVTVQAFCETNEHVLAFVKERE